MSDNSTYTYVGTGWGFPPTFHKEKGGVVMIADMEDINSSLEILLSTIVGERIMQPEFGCNLQTFLFESINLTLIRRMEEMIKDAIIHYEARIKLLSVVLETEVLEGKIDIRVEYEIRGTNSRFNYVYPFYIEEGTNVNK